MHRWHLGSDRFGQLKADAAKARPRSGKALAIALAVGGLVLLSTCNPFVKKPSVPVVTGPDVGVVGIPVEFRATSTDPNGDSVAFMFDWGDTTTKVWTDFVLSDETLSVSHAYAESSNCVVKAKAKNGKGTESGWSSGHLVQLSGVGPGYPDSLVAEVRLPGYGKVNSMLCSRDGRLLYVAISQETHVAVVQTGDLQIVDTILVGPDPEDMVLSADGSLLYVALAGCDSVKTIRTSDGTVVRSIAVGREPRAVAITPSGDFLYIALSAEDSICKLRTLDGVVERKLPSPGYPDALAIDGTTGCLYAVSVYGGEVLKYSLTNDSLAGRLQIVQGLTAVATHPGSGGVYVGDCQGRLFTVPFDMVAVAETLQYYGCISDIAFTPDSLYVLTPTSEHHGLPITRVDRDLNVGWIRNEGLITGVAVSPDGHRIYAGDDYRMRISVFERR